MLNDYECTHTYYTCTYLGHSEVMQSIYPSNYNYSNSLLSVQSTILINETQARNLQVDTDCIRLAFATLQHTPSTGFLPQCLPCCGVLVFDPEYTMCTLSSSFPVLILISCGALKVGYKYKSVSRTSQTH